MTARYVCSDYRDPNLTPRRLQAIDRGLGVRLVLFDTPAFYAAWESLYYAEVPLVAVAARESFGDQHVRRMMTIYAGKLRGMAPEFWLLGNEPNAPVGAESSFSLEPSAFADIYLEAASGVKSVLPGASCCFGGILGSDYAYVDAVLSAMLGSPDGIDVHYPNDASVLQGWRERYALPFTCMEWSYVGKKVTPRAVADWIDDMEQYVDAQANFRLTEAQDAPGVGLLTPNGTHRKPWRDLAGAYKLLSAA